MSSVDAANDPPQPPDSVPTPADQPPSQPPPDPAADPSTDADTPATAPEVDPPTDAGEPQPDASAPTPTDGPSPSNEVLGATTSNEPTEPVDVGEHSQGGVDDSQQWADDDSHELKRVKVYELIGSRWVDQGTAFCFGDFQENEALLIARAEEDFNRIILTTTIRATDVYQRQQETLIVWTEPDGVDYALSFQDPEGCAEVWQFIEEVQRHMNAGEDMSLTSSPLIGPDGPEPSITTANIIRSGRLPQPALGIIGEIDTAIKTLARTAVVKERVCEYIQNEEYIKALIDVFHQAEDLESLHDLHALFGCTQTVLLLNEHSLYEHILDDEIFLGVVGMLEYDPEFPNYKANYRDFLRETSHYHQPIPIRDEMIQRKIHHTYRLQFLKDVVLARAIDDSTFNVLNSSIIFNQIDIINHVQNDPNFLREIAGMFMDDDLLALLGLAKPSEPPKDPTADGAKDSDKMDVDTADPKPNGAPQSNSTPPPAVAGPSSTSGSKLPSEEELNRRREVVFLVQQLCMMGKNVQLPARMALFRALVDRGLVFAVQWGLAQPEDDERGRQMIATSGEVLMALLDHDLNGVRGHVLKQLGTIERERAAGRDVRDKETVLMLMCRVLVRSKDLAVQSLVGEALRLLLELLTGEMEGPNIGIKMLQRSKDDPGIEKFLDYFYKFCMDILFKPFQDIPESKDFNDPVFVLSREKTNLFLWLCDLLSNFTQQHSFRSHFFVLSSNIAPRVATLLRSKDKHLRLAAFRFFRTCLRLKNGNIFKHLIKHDVFKPILDLTARECRRDNLVSSTCLEYFDYMRREGIKDLIVHCMTRHGETVRSLAESPLVGARFKDFIARFDMFMEPPPVEKIEKPPPIQRWGQARLVDTAEEDYFNADDEEDEPVSIVSTPPPSARTGASNKRKRLLRSQLPVPIPIPPTRTMRPSVNGHPLARPPAPLPLGSLVGDYGDADDLPDALAPENQQPGTITTTPSATSGRASPLPGTFTPLAYTPTPSGDSPSPSPGAGAPPGANAGAGTGGTGAPPASPRMPHRTVSVKSALTLEDDSDILAELSKGAGALLPRISGMADVAAGAKRRRAERDDADDDDELLERLASKAKRPAPSPGPGPTTRSKADPDAGSNPNKPGTAAVAGKGGADEAGAGPGPKKLKLKFGAIGAAVASSPAPPPSTKGSSPSSTGTKDGDNG